MQATQDDRGHLVVLDVGEEVMAVLTAYVAEQGLTAGVVSGIGAVRDTTLGYFDIEANVYQRKVVAPSCEVVSFLGNISLVEGTPFIHAHLALGLPDFSVRAGHCFRATISVTGEFYIDPHGFTPARFAPPQGFALKTIDLSRSRPA